MHEKTTFAKKELDMNGKDDLLNDILPMVINGILDPEYLTGKKKKEEHQNDSEEKDQEKEKEDL